MNIVNWESDSSVDDEDVDDADLDLNSTLWTKKTRTTKRRWDDDDDVLLIPTMTRRSLSLGVGVVASEGSAIQSKI